MSSTPITTRFAPSPTGRLHLGNARTALFNFLLARGGRGRFVLRVEDTDAERGSAEHLASQLEDLRWLGCDWDAGPGVEDEHGPYRQSERGGLYQAHYRVLEERGLAYLCYCSPTELEVSRRTQLAAGRPPRYAGTCRSLDADARERHERSGRRPTLRFRVPDGRMVEFDDLVRGPQSFATDDIGDFVIRRADGVPVFFFCNALDDALMGVTHVLRGEDHVANTPRQLLLLEALGLAAPAYGHLPLLLDAGGSPLSKRRGSVGVGELRERGFLAGAVSNYLLRLGHAGAPDGWVDPAAQPGCFALDKVGRAPAHYDEVQLVHWQREAVKRLDGPAFDVWLAPHLPASLPPAERRRLGALIHHNLVFPEDARHWVDVLFGALPTPAPADRQLVEEAGDAFFAEALAALEATGPDLAALARELRRRTGRKGAALFMPLRVALTGRRDGPELAPLIAALPAGTLRDRLRACAGRGQGGD
jgi:nondiscriminating glutamyl-tRNA synthetase